MGEVLLRLFYILLMYHRITTMLTYILVIIAIVSLMYVVSGYQEGFMGMGAGIGGVAGWSDFPAAQDTRLLDGSHQRASNQHVSNHTSADLSAIQPRTAMSSFEQVTNNKRDWNTPDNGTCTPAEFCGTLYGSRIGGISPEPSFSQFSGSQKRVNMFTQ